MSLTSSLTTRPTAPSPTDLAARVSSHPADAVPTAVRGTRRTSAQHLLAPVVGTGVLMAAYLALRPYGDAAGATTPAAGEAFASSWWVVAHVCGALALACVGRLATRLHDVLGTPLTAAARTLALAGSVLVLPYYGAEAFALHHLGLAARTGDPDALLLVEPIRSDPIAMTTFGLGLLALAAGGLLVGLAWQRSVSLPGPRWAAWPLAVMVALVLPQYYLPVAGRIAFGPAYALAAGVLALALVRRSGGVQHAQS